LKTKTTRVDFGGKSLDIDVPEHAVVIEFQDPPSLPDPAEAARKAISEPYGSPPLSEIAKPGMRIVIGFDDPTRPAVTVQTIVPIIVSALLEAGVDESDILLICACSNHRKWAPGELEAYLGSDVFSRFWSDGRIINHDCSDSSQLKFLGISPIGKYYVELNRHFVEADLMIYVGNVGPGGFRTYTGTGAVIGLASTRSIASHHSLHRSRTARPPHSVKDDLNTQLELATGKRVFYVNAVTGVAGKTVGVFAGTCKEVKVPAWELAESIFRYPAPQADVMVIGIPQTVGHGSADNTLIAAIGVTSPPRFCPGHPVLRQGGVVIGLSPSRGYIDPEQYPAYQEVLDLYARYHNLSSLVDHEQEFDQRPTYKVRYTHGYGYPPLHGFWLLYQCSYTFARASAVIMAGTCNPAAFRALGITPAVDFKEAWNLATKIVGADPVTVIAPTFWSRRAFKFDVKA
jgi:nickel-dependent lactate racemase